LNQMRRLKVINPTLVLKVSRRSADYLLRESQAGPARQVCMEDLKSLRASPHDDEWQGLLADLGRSVGQMATALAAMRLAMDRLSQIGPAPAADSETLDSPFAPDGSKADTDAAVAPPESEPDADLATSAAWTWPDGSNAPDHETGNGRLRKLRAVDALADPVSSESSHSSADAPEATGHNDPPPPVEVPRASKPPAIDWSTAEPKAWMLSPPPSSGSEPSQPGTGQSSASTPSPSPTATPSRESLPAARIDSTMPGSWPTAGFKALEKTNPTAANQDPSIAVSGSPNVPDEAREQVRRGVEMAGAEVDAARSNASESTHDEHGATIPAEQDQNAVREQVRRAVEMTRAELGGEGPASRSEGTTPTSEPSETDGDQNAVREQVRLAVEMARIELDTPGPSTGLDQAASAHAPDREQAAPSEVPVSPAETAGSGRAPAGADEHFGAIPTIIIESPGGRIELAYIYEMLSQLDCAATANLVNYLPHSVTVTLGALNLPDSDWIKRAVETAFGRTCNLVVDARRATIRLGDMEARVA
jgi:hypothetical protein